MKQQISNQSLYFTLNITVMEIAVGEYEVDFTRMMAAAIKKYYEDRDKYDLEQLQATTESILRASQHGNCDKTNVTIYEFANANNNDDVTIKKFKEIREVKETVSKFRMEKHTETASLLMQFFVLFDRNYKASSRNIVSCLRCIEGSFPSRLLDDTHVFIPISSSSY